MEPKETSLRDDALASARKSTRLRITAFVLVFRNIRPVLFTRVCEMDYGGRQISLAALWGSMIRTSVGVHPPDDVNPDLPTCGGEMENVDGCNVQANDCERLMLCKNVSESGHAGWNPKRVRRRN